MAGRAGAGPRLFELLAWTAVLVAVSFTLARLHYQTRDPDSVLYARIAAEMSRQPIDRWIAPRWPVGSYEQGLYREHPIGTFLFPAIVARLGFHAEEAAYAVNTLFQILALVLVPRFAMALVEGHEARALAWILQLLPIAFTYRTARTRRPRSSSAWWPRSSGRSSRGISCGGRSSPRLRSSSSCS